MEPVEYPITDVLDLHTFLPKEVPGLLDEYFRTCIEKKIFQVRVIHGKGTGVLKRRVYAILSKDPKVVSFKEAPATAGGWGAVLVALRKEENSNGETPDDSRVEPRQFPGGNDTGSP